MSRSVRTNIAQGNYLCNVGPWQIKENYLYNAVSIILGQHCVRILCKNIVLPILSKYVWDNIAQDTYLTVLAQRGKTCFRTKTGCNFQCLIACFLTGYNITKESWFFLFNVGSGVHVWLAGQQWTGADIDWNIIKSIFLKKTFSSNIKQSKFFSMNDSF